MSSPLLSQMADDLKAGKLPESMPLVGYVVEGEFQPVWINRGEDRYIIAFPGLTVQEGDAYIRRHDLEGFCGDIPTAEIVRFAMQENVGVLFMPERPYDAGALPTEGEGQ
jgi:hypothetical protein